MEYFIYCFIDPRNPGKYIYNISDNSIIELDYKPIYIGKGKNNRAKNHLTLYKKSNIRFHNKLRSIINEGLDPKFMYLKTNLSEEESFKYEIELIKAIGRIENGGSLTNLTDGGEGRSGNLASSETKLKMSKSRKGKKIKPMSEETKIKISNSLCDLYSTKSNELMGIKFDEFYGYEKSTEIKQKMSKKASERKGDRNSMYGKNHTKESKDKMRNNRVIITGEYHHNYGKTIPEDKKTSSNWEITNINGDVIVIRNLNKYCDENNLNPTCMRDIYYGRMKSHRGWIKVVKIEDIK